MMKGKGKVRERMGEGNFCSSVVVEKVSQDKTHGAFVLGFDRQSQK